MKGTSWSRRCATLRVSGRLIGYVVMNDHVHVVVKPAAANTIGKNRNPMMLPTRSMPCVHPTAEPLIGVGKDNAA